MEESILSLTQHKWSATNGPLSPYLFDLHDLRIPTFLHFPHFLATVVSYLVLQPSLLSCYPPVLLNLILSSFTSLHQSGGF